MDQLGTVVSDGLNLRERPGSSPKDIITALGPGTRLVVLERREGNVAKWLRVRVQGSGEEGWVAETSMGDRYVKLDAPRKTTLPGDSDFYPDWKFWLVAGALVAVVAAMLIVLR